MPSHPAPDALPPVARVDAARGHGRARELVLALALTASVFLVYFRSPIQKMGDAEFTLLVSEQLLVHRSLALDEYFWPQQEPRYYPGMRANHRWPRQVQPNGARRAEQRGEREGPLYYIYPHGTSMLSVPFVAVARALGVSLVGEDGRHDPAAERQVQRWAASLVVAATVALLYGMARVLLDRIPSVMVALAAALGTQLWSTASRSLQSHAFGVLLTSALCWLLLRRAAGRGRAHPVLFATLSAWSFFVRPTAVFVIVPLTIVFLVRERRSAAPVLATGALWLVAFVAHSRATFGSWLPDYYGRGSGFGLDTFMTGLTGQLVSPSRGLIVFVPLVLVVLTLVAVRWRRLPHPTLAVGACVVIGVHTLFVASFQNWWGGHSYGARFATDLVPLFTLLAVLGLAARAVDPATSSGTRRWVARGCTTLAFGVGALFNGAGAISEGGVRWNLVPVPIGEDPARAFDWRRPQWLCALAPALLDGLEPPEGSPPAAARIDDE